MTLLVSLRVFFEVADRKWLVTGGVSTALCLLFFPSLMNSGLLNEAAVRCSKDFALFGGISKVISTTSAVPLPLHDGIRINLEAVNRLNPNDPRTTIWLGLLALVQADYGSARRFFLLSQLREPNDARVNFLLGLVSHKTGDSAGAIRQWGRLGQGEAILIGIADRLFSQGRSSEAVTYYRAAVGINRYSPDGHLKLAELLYALDKRDEALDHYLFAFKLGTAPSYLSLPEALYHAALMLSERQRYAEATSALERAISIVPGYTYYLASLGEIYGFSGDYERADHWLTEAIHTSASTGYPYWMLGKYYLRRQKLDLAVSAFEQAVYREPQGPHHFYGSLGQACIATGDVERAVWAFGEALRRSPGNTSYINWLRDAKDQVDRRTH